MFSPFPIILLIFLVAIAVINGLAEVNSWYWTHRWLDMPMHFAGGAWLASTALWWQHSRQGITSREFTHLLSVCLISAVGIGLLWEAYEGIVGFFTVGHINEMSDTLKDLLFDILGGTTVAILMWTRGKLKKQI